MTFEEFEKKVNLLVKLGFIIEVSSYYKDKKIAIIIPASARVVEAWGNTMQEAYDNAISELQKIK